MIGYELPKDKFSNDFIQFVKVCLSPQRSRF
jgi:hypothetical protein